MTYSVLINLDFVQATPHKMCMFLHVTDKWLKAIDEFEGKYTGAVFLDLAKAFDMVDNSTLCDKSVPSLAFSIWHCS